MKATSSLFFACFLTIFILFLNACESKQTPSSLVGRWALKEGELNGQRAPSLENIFFEFGKDSVKTNFTVSENEESAAFTLKDSTIKQKTAEPIEYSIEEMSDSTLELLTELKGYEFRLFLTKE